MWRQPSKRNPEYGTKELHMSLQRIIISPRTERMLLAWVAKSKVEVARRKRVKTHAGKCDTDPYVFTKIRELASWTENERGGLVTCFLTILELEDFSCH